ncbi:MAG TPA: hypothetical protein VEJ41_04845 [Candidatus Acidoferrales bacterium]|nr:hypothetical protein [Candidatus Acidoferrales bacterium]
MGSPQQWVAGVRRQVDLKGVDAEAQRPVVLGVAGPRRDIFIDELTRIGEIRPGAIATGETLGDLAVDTGSILRVAVYCPETDSHNGALDHVATLPFAVCVLRPQEDPAKGSSPTSAPSPKPAIGHASVYPVSAPELAQYRRFLMPDIVRLYRDHETALAASIPAFRPVVAAKLTHDCAMTCLKIAAASAIADHIPVVGLLVGGITSAGDTIAITALQMRMLLRIASAYGKKPEFARILELVPVVGGGYGWRALAREASGFIPIAGIPIKAAIAYAGTLVVGQVAAHYYETGLHMSRGAIGAAYKEASERAKAFARRALPGRKRT